MLNSDEVFCLAHWLIEIDIQSSQNIPFTIMLLPTPYTRLVIAASLCCTTNYEIRSATTKIATATRICVRLYAATVANSSFLFERNAVRRNIFYRDIYIPNINLKFSTYGCDSF